jgi:hypothetical protein
MASTIKSTTTSTTKKVAGKTVKTTTAETTVVATSDSIALDKNKKKVETLISELTRLREAITDLEKNKQEITEAIYAVMGWEQVKVGEKTRWVGVAKKGTIKGAVRITISERKRTDVDNKKLELDYPEVYASVAYDNPYSVIITK